jgi:hypothetical protein
MNQEDAIDDKKKSLHYFLFFPKKEVDPAVATFTTHHSFTSH